MKTIIKMYLFRDCPLFRYMDDIKDLEEQPDTVVDWLKTTIIL